MIKAAVKVEVKKTTVRSLNLNEAQVAADMKQHDVEAAIRALLKEK